MRKFAFILIYIALSGFIITTIVNLLHMPGIGKVFFILSCFFVLSWILILPFLPAKDNIYRFAILKKYVAPNSKTIPLISEELNAYVGIYSNEDLKMKIYVTKNDTANTLNARANDQSAFPLIAIDKNVFNFTEAGLVMEFRPDNNKFVLIQYGGYFPFIKEA